MHWFGLVSPKIDVVFALSLNYSSKCEQFVGVDNCYLRLANKVFSLATAAKDDNRDMTLNNPGADPERNLTRAQPKSRGCGYMGVALSMGSYKHDLLDAAQKNASLRYFNASTKNKLLKTELVLGGSVMNATASLMATAKCKEVGSSQKVEYTCEGHPHKQ